MMNETGTEKKLFFYYFLRFTLKKRRNLDEYDRSFSNGRNI